MTPEFEITELHRRLANLVMLGKVVDVNFDSSIPRLKVKLGELQTAWLPMLTQRAGKDLSWWPLEIGEQVVVLSPSGELAQGVVLGAINQRVFAAAGDRVGVHRHVYDDGAVIEYDRDAHRLSAVLPSNATTEIVSDGGITLVGDVTVTGNIKASGDVSDHTRSMKADREIYNSHTHSGIKPGPGTTAIPNHTQ